MFKTVLENFNAIICEITMQASKLVYILNCLNHGPWTSIWTPKGIQSSCRFSIVKINVQHRKMKGIYI